MCMTKRMSNELMIDWANRVNGTPNTNRSHCLFDGETLEKGTGFALVLPETGVMPRYICPRCLDKLTGKKPYHFNANNRISDGLGTVKTGNEEQYTIGVELEYSTNRVARKARFTFKVLVERAFNVIEEDDCTVSGEFPTDKMNGGNILSKVLHKLEVYGFMPYFDVECVGAHIHVECTCIEFVRNWYNTLFVPLCEYIQAHDSAWIVDKFGRDFGSYRYPIDRNSNCMTHSNFVNCQHDHTLEFRLPRIRTAEQYMNVVYFWRSAVALLNNTAWIERTSSNRDARKAQASALANEIVTIARDYFGD